MKNIFRILLSFIILLNISAKAQYNEAPSTAERFPTIPPFTLIGIDSTNFTREDLAKNKKTIIMYFSPDCDHCQAQTEALLKNIDKLKGFQILMTTYDHYEKMVDFYKKYQLANYPAIKLGRDFQFFFVPYYKIIDMPFIALYNDKGELVKTYRSSVTAEKLTEALEKNVKKKR